MPNSQSLNRNQISRRQALLLSATAGIGAALTGTARASDSIKTAVHQEPGTCSTPRKAVADTQYGKVRGFVDQLIFERLRRILAGMDSARNFASGTIPDVVFNGYLACVTNAYAASDGDIFSYYFKKYHLGPLIGMRTWGGVRGIRGFVPLLDGGYITRPEFSFYGLDSKWVVENYGVAPDIEVDNTPDLVMNGQDPQLERAIEEVMKEIKEHPKKLPPRPPDMPAYPNGPG